MKTSLAEGRSDYERYYLDQVGLGSNKDIDYENYYRAQVGNGSIAFYQGSPTQRGYGLGNILASAFRRAVPLLKKGAILIGKKFLRTGAKVATDVASGVSFKNSLKDHGMTAGKETISELRDMVKQKMSGNGIKRKRKRIQLVSSIVAKKRRRRAPKHSDIFSK